MFIFLFSLQILSRVSLLINIIIIIHDCRMKDPESSSIRKAGWILAVRLEPTDLEVTLFRKVISGEQEATGGGGGVTGLLWLEPVKNLPVRTGKKGPAADWP